MTKKQHTAPAAKTNSALYYFVRVFQRLALCLTITFTGLYWAILVTRSNDIGQYQGSGINAAAPKSYAITWALITIVISLSLLAIARFRKYEKPLIVDSVVVALFCLVSALVAQSFVYKPF